MGLRGGFVAAVARGIREAERANQQELRDRRRGADANARDQSRLRQQVARENAVAYRESREATAVRLTVEAEARMRVLQNVLLAHPRAAAGPSGSGFSPEVVCQRAFQQLRPTFAQTYFDSSAAVGTKPAAPDIKNFTTVVPRPSVVARMFGGAARHAADVERAAALDAKRLDFAQMRHCGQVVEWEIRVADARKAHEAEETLRAEQVVTQSAMIDAWEQGLRDQDPEAVIEYVSHVLDSSNYPEDIDEEYDASYSPDSRILTLEYALPGPNVVPTAKAYSYVRSSDEVREKARPKAEIAASYRSLIAALSLRTIREIFSATPEACLEAITFHGVFEGIDPTTGSRIRPCLVSANVSRDAISAIQLSLVEPTKCLLGLGAVVSKKPEDLIGVRRVDEGGRIDARYVSSSRPRT